MTTAALSRVARDSDQKYTTTPLDEAALAAQAKNKLGGQPGLDSEFCRPDDCLRLFGLKKGTVYNLARDGRIRLITLRKKGDKRGVSLVNIPSVRAFLHGLLEQQAPALTTAQ